ncbi:MAG: hypothetical protein M0D57_13750 [Sphingobacteriales bacterium JAD_PAG50586_3]|nr:MAG: hypothetical protein M0D57_13750 [Sphingobacteriales bacterium JAD_PAG50586_3]
MEAELIVLLVVQLIGSVSFARFEIETPIIKKTLKWLILDGLTIGLYFLIGHYSLILPSLLIGLGTTFHFIWCKRNGIHPLKATPKKKYYKLRGWKWEE